MSSVLQCQQIMSYSSDSSTKPLMAAFSPFWAFGMWWHQRGKHMLSGTLASKMLLLTLACLDTVYTSPGREDPSSESPDRKCFRTMDSQRGSEADSNWQIPTPRPGPPRPAFTSRTELEKESFLPCPSYCKPHRTFSQLWFL